ncbi:sensor histidine kinase [Flavobacterium sp. ASW18X]|uniref:sensor histidine kinase n=1 Tax=Flavobacterium sp. ASW18X TaxID=2572595 RepID=UPI0010ADBFA0|nr:sensor histidine kinase [Flavobacterium sp. ASW18X]
MKNTVNLLAKASEELKNEQEPGNSSFDPYEITIKHHLIFWLIYFAFNTLRWGSYFDDYEYSVKTNIIGFPIHMALTYLNIYVLMPKFVYTRKYLSYTILVICALFVMLLAKYNLTYYLVSTNVWPEGPEPIQNLTFNYGIQMMLGELYVVSFVTAIKLTIDWLRERNKLYEMEKRQLSTELRFLRLQVSPHFFFNTLNNIYSLTLTKSDKAPIVILKLSELMRYLLYATDKRRQSLTNEIECLQNYIDLERIRFDENLEVNISISGDLTDKEISPMLLMPLIENSIKHGVSKNLGKNKIGLDITVLEDFLYFELTNSCPQDRKPNTTSKNFGGIGLSNVKKRLELGYEPEDYKLNLIDKGHTFIIKLKLRV